MNGSLWSKWKYGIVYLLLIPGFALIFSMLPNDFYQSTISQEGVINAHEKQIAKALTAILEKRIVERENNNKYVDFCTLDNFETITTSKNIHDVTPIIRYGKDGDYVRSIWANVTLHTNCDDSWSKQTLFNINIDIRYGENIKLHLTQFFPEFSMRSGPNQGDIFHQVTTTIEAFSST